MLCCKEYGLQRNEKASGKTVVLAGHNMQAFDRRMQNDFNRTVGVKGNPMFDGVWGVDVRNADGLIVVSDMTTGFWAFRMDGFSGWNGEQWGFPNVSSAQNWDSGPGGSNR